MSKLLPLQYKGSRNYLHGSDFYNWLSANANEITGKNGSFIDRLTFRRFATRICEITATKPQEPDKITGQVRFALPDQHPALKFFIVETDQEVTGSYAFDESSILHAVERDLAHKRIILPRRSDFTPVEEVIVLTKDLSSGLSPLATGKWLFGQMDLGEPLADNYVSLEIRMKSLIEAKFSVSDILVDDRQIGSIRFIVGSPA